jgi:hypothetical protein
MIARQYVGKEVVTDLNCTWSRVQNLQAQPTIWFMFKANYIVLESFWLLKEK